MAKFKQMRSEGLFMNPFKKEAGSLSPEQTLSAVHEIKRFVLSQVTPGYRHYFEW